MNLAADFSDALLDEIAERVVAKLAERQAAAPADDGWLRGAAAIARHIDAKVSRVYAHEQIGLPVEKDGSGLIARKSALDAWIRAGGGKRL